MVYPCPKDSFEICNVGTIPSLGLGVGRRAYSHDRTVCTAYSSVPPSRQYPLKHVKIADSAEVVRRLSLPSLEVGLINGGVGQVEIRRQHSSFVPWFVREGSFIPSFVITYFA